MGLPAGLSQDFQQAKPISSFNGLTWLYCFALIYVGDQVLPCYELHFWFSGKLSDDFTSTFLSLAFPGPITYAMNVSEET